MFSWCVAIPFQKFPLPLKKVLFFKLKTQAFFKIQLQSQKFVFFIEDENQP